MPQVIEGVEAVSAERIERLSRNDLSGMADLLDAELVYVHSTGQVHDKSQLLRFFEQELRVTAIERRLQSHDEDGNLACLTFVQVMQAQLRREPQVAIQARSRFIEVWRRVGESWRLLRVQSTALADHSTPTRR
jgi:hypothetical protein